MRTALCSASSDDIAPKVAADQGYQNAKKNTPNTARLEHDKALERVIVSLLKDDTELFKQFFQNESFRRLLPTRCSILRMRRMPVTS